jgi:NAD-dependent deacetylase
MEHQLQELIDRSRRIVFFGGAGVSTESGIPDFRSAQGLYSRAGPVPPEMILSRPYFEQQPSEFFDFYRQSVLHPEAKPNAAHFKLAELERLGRLSAIVTQNIDGLHQAAGSTNVIELHGSVQRNICRGCGKRYSMQQVYASVGLPLCACGSLIEPQVVLYEDPLDLDMLQAAADQISNADLLIIGGTSLQVNPAAALVDYFCGAQMVVIDPAGFPVRSHQIGLTAAALVIRRPIGQTMSQIVATAPQSG